MPWRWPRTRGSPRDCAQRPLPSMMIATWRGSCSGRRPSTASCSRPFQEIRPDESPRVADSRGRRRGFRRPWCRSAWPRRHVGQSPARPGFRRPRPRASPAGRDRPRRSRRARRPGGPGTGRNPGPSRGRSRQDRTPVMSSRPAGKRLVDRAAPRQVVEVRGEIGDPAALIVLVGDGDVQRVDPAEDVQQHHRDLGRRR